MRTVIRYQSQLLYRRSYKPATRYHFRPRQKPAAPRPSQSGRPANPHEN
jgi:hypothetical protein